MTSERNASRHTDVVTAMKVDSVPEDYPTAPIPLDDATWNKILDGLPGRRAAFASHRGTREFVDAVIWKAELRVCWSDLPRTAIPMHTVYVRFGRWVTDSVWSHVIDGLSDQPDRRECLINLVKEYESSMNRRKLRLEVVDRLRGSSSDLADEPLNRPSLTSGGEPKR